MHSRVTSQELVNSALQEITTLSLLEFKEVRAQEGTVVIDIRDVRELHRLGKIPEAVHMPRGMLEFWFDAECPYYSKEVLADAERVVLYCAAGARSALAALTIKNMGIKQVSHLEGGFNHWLAVGEDIERVEDKHHPASS